MNGSISKELNSIDWKKIGTGALIAVIGALLTYLTQVVSGLDLGAFTPIVVSGWSILANITRKWITDYSTQQEVVV
ncbi:hypothetical protein M0R04_10045 [Candidatus Dojkabacteria bacterium]|jgi:hypothetical protein|nr:hypothetical protein [Candidatus Dojkabacteria bacterium]